MIDEFSPYGFPIYISDNCSTDNTTSVVSSLEKDYDNMKYARNNSNLGLYRNILNVMQMAETRYILFMGDDDTIKKGSVEKIVNLMLKNPDFLVLNSVSYDKELTYERYARLIYCTEDVKYNDRSVQNLLSNLKKWSYHGYMPAMIMKRSLLEPRISKYKNPDFPLYDTAWLSLALFYEAIKNGKGLFVCEPIVLNRENPRPYGKNYWEYSYVDRIRALKYLEKAGYSRKIVVDVIKSRLIDLVYDAIMAKAEHVSAPLFTDYIKQEDSIPLSNKIVIKILDLAPPSLMKLAKNVVLSVKESRVHP